MSDSEKQLATNDQTQTEEKPEEEASQAGRSRRKRAIVDCDSNGECDVTGGRALLLD